MDILKKRWFAYKLLKSLYGLLIGQPDVSVWLARILQKKNIATVVQIGSNDGKTGDPLHNLILKNKNWKVVFVEPVPSLFQKLKANYGVNDRFIFENCAINQGEQQDFYWVDEERAKMEITGLPSWFNQLGSFDKSHITKHMDGLLTPFIRSEIVRGKTLNELLSVNKISKLDVLHIDAEGYDWKIVSQLDLKKITPEIILFEFTHLLKDERESAIDFLKPKYHLFSIRSDFLCVLKSADFFKHYRDKRLSKFQIA